MDTPQTIINFNAWMMVYASSTPSPASPSIYSCYMLPEPSSYLSSFDDNELSMDLNVDTMCALAAQSGYMIVTYTNMAATVNAIGMWPIVVLWVECQLVSMLVVSQLPLHLRLLKLILL